MFDKYLDKKDTDVVELQKYEETDKLWQRMKEANDQLLKLIEDRRKEL